MRPQDSVAFGEVLNEDGDCIAQFRSYDLAIQFMREYGNEEWMCQLRTLYFADALPLQQVYDDVTIDSLSDFIHYDGKTAGVIEQQGDSSPNATQGEPVKAMIARLEADNAALRAELASARAWGMAWRELARLHNHVHGKFSWRLNYRRWKSVWQAHKLQRAADKQEG